MKRAANWQTLVRKSAQTRIRINHHAGRHDRNFDWEHGSISTGPVLKNLCVLAVLTLSSALVYESRVDINHWSLRISQLDTSQSLLAHSVLLTVANLKNPSQSQLKVTRCLSLCELFLQFPTADGTNATEWVESGVETDRNNKIVFLSWFSRRM